MAIRIEPVKVEEATPRQREALERTRAALGKVPGLYATFAQAPDVLAALLQFQGALQNGGLSARDRNLIDLHVSQLNGCAYCVSAHTVIASANGLPDAEILRIRDGQGETARDAPSWVSPAAWRRAGLGAAAEIAQAREAGLSNPQDFRVREAIRRGDDRMGRNAVGAAVQLGDVQIDQIAIARREPALLQRSLELEERGENVGACANVAYSPGTLPSAALVLSSASRWRRAASSTFTGKV